MQQGLRSLSRFARKSPFERFLWGEHVFERKIEDFSFKNVLAPIGFFRAIFKRSEKEPVLRTKQVGDSKEPAYHPPNCLKPDNHRQF
jgi:hypothetical protein